jgi:RND family efflux transporter MFP subunit
MKGKFYFVIPPLIIVSLVGWRLAVKHNDGVVKTAQRLARSNAAPPVTLASADIRDVTHVFEATGSLEAPLNVKIAPKVAGRIEYLMVHEGDRIHKGEILVRIDPTEVEGEVQQARAALAEAQYRLAQAQLTQNPTNVGVNSQIRQQKAGLGSAKADYKQVRENYNAQVAAAEASVTDAVGKVRSAEAAVGNAKAEIRSAQANLANAHAKCDRTEDLYKQGFTAAQDVDDAKAAVEVQQANVDVANGQLNSAIAARDSSVAQKASADENLRIVKTKGTADIEASRARFIQSQASVELANANNWQKPAYQQSIAALKASVAAARASLDSAKARLSDTVLKSPLDGYVTSRLADPGSMATAGTAILGVQFMKQVWVAISVPEEISTKVHIGQTASITLDSIPGRTFTGSVIQVNPSVDPLSRQFTVRVILSNPDNLLHPGMYASVALETERAPHSTVVPREAIQDEQTAPYVILVDRDMKSHRMPVALGASDTTYTSIISGVSPGDKVVVMAGVPLKDGQKVRTGGYKESAGGHGKR